MNLKATIAAAALAVASTTAVMSDENAVMSMSDAPNITVVYKWTAHQGQLDTLVNVYKGVTQQMYDTVKWSHLFGQVRSVSKVYRV